MDIKVKVIKGEIIRNKTSHLPGKVLTVPEAEGKVLVAKGLAVIIKPFKPAKTEITPVEPVKAEKKEPVKKARKKKGKE